MDELIKSQVSLNDSLSAPKFPLSDSIPSHNATKKSDVVDAVSLTSFDISIAPSTISVPLLYKLSNLADAL